MKINKHIEIVRSSSKRFSSMSQVSCDAIYDVLRAHYVEVGVSVISDETDLRTLVMTNPDLVFLGAQYIPKDTTDGVLDSERIWLANFLEDNQIAYTGSASIAHKREQNKPLAKQCALDAGHNTSPYDVITQYMSLDSMQLRLTFPLFVKPTDRGGGLGVDSESVVHNVRELTHKILSIRDKYGSDSLVEEYLPGREFSVAILRSPTSDYLVMPIELIAPEDFRGVRMLSSRVKSADAERHSEVVDESIRRQICQLSLGIFHTLGARDYGRIDIRLDKHGTAQFLEANLLPSLIQGYGSFPKSCVLNSGLQYDAMILRIVELGFARQQNYSLPMLSPVIRAITADLITPEPSFIA